MTITQLRLVRLKRSSLSELKICEGSFFFFQNSRGQTPSLLLKALQINHFVGFPDNQVGSSDSKILSFSYLSTLYLLFKF